eukprot:CAMPEP_0197910240 /NCGR_PEP_ID=MMETSP1439-20131203/70508_1 /TAXON_ID=66791 /ORGANISM="Gonyaulax spinifera, Strain CCMP409" /LENGTH=107 /DNA_ID=CAMNT_0043531873 /DNA_START=10 /DNA_END=333 /DNA_ORIENTATION=-
MHGRIARLKQPLAAQAAATSSRNKKLSALLASGAVAAEQRLTARRDARPGAALPCPQERGADGTRKTSPGACPRFQHWRCGPNHELLALDSAGWKELFGCQLIAVLE